MCDFQLIGIGCMQRDESIHTCVSSGMHKAVPQVGQQVFVWLAYVTLLLMSTDYLSSSLP